MKMLLIYSKQKPDCTKLYQLELNCITESKCTKMYLSLNCTDMYQIVKPLFSCRCKVWYGDPHNILKPVFTN